MARRTKAETEQTRLDIIAAARRVFAGRGVSRTTLADIAKEAGVTRGAIYWHFRNKPDLFFAMMEQVSLPLVDLIDENLPAQNPGDPLRAIQASMNEILRLLSTVVIQAGGIQNTVEASHKDLLETRQALTSMQEELAETRQLLNEDALTGALNRRGLDQTLMREIARAQRLSSKLSLAMVDLDFFKKVNDQHGHEAGDQMLVHFSSLIKSVLRKSDALVRYGGEEFTLILPETDGRGAHFVLARLQQLMSKSPLTFEGIQINTTFSAGIATLRGDENGHALLRRADEALYAAKNGGRNAIKIAA
jgi:diguanylate cyclase (GGDEF)-like protein